MSRIIKPSLGELIDGRFRQHPRYRGCVLHLPLNEGGGITAYNAVGYDYHGVLTEGPTWQIGPFGPCVDFDGSNDDILIASRLGDNPQISIVIWASIEGSDTTGAELLSIADNVMLRHRVAAGGLSATFYDGTTWHDVNYTVSAVGTGWHCFAYTYTPGRQKLYQDGVEVGSGSFTETISYTGSGGAVRTRLGQHGGTSTAWNLNGKISEARVYNRELTPGEIQSFYTDPFLEFEDAADRAAFEFDFAGQLRRSSTSRILQPYNLCEPFPGAP